ncbi:ABC transporter permease, partial [Phocaeicola dorei]
MIKLYIKQAFYQLRENRLISLVSIIGTALAICMIMVIVLVLEVRITDCVPEVNR